MITKKQAESDDDSKRRTLTSALMVWFLFMPAFFGFGAVLVWLAPGITHADPEWHRVVRWTTVVVIFSVMAVTIKRFADGVLYGSNLAYKGMGVQTVASFVGGGLIIAAIYLGWGLIGVAGAHLVGISLAVVIVYWIAGKNVPWFGLQKPNRDEVKRTLGLSGWFTLSAFVESILLSGDVILLGFITRPELVTQLVVTGYAIQSITVMILFPVAAAMPGLGEIVGRKQFDRARDLRREGLFYSWLLATGLGTTVLFCNPAFVTLWVGEAQYAGDSVNFLLVITILQLTLIRRDSDLINLSLKIRARVILEAIAVSISIGVSFIFVPQYEILGLCGSLILGRLVLTLAYPWLIRGVLNDEEPRRWPRLAQRVLLTLVLFTAAWWGEQRVSIHGWFPLIFCALAALGISIFVCYQLGLRREERQKLLFRIRALNVGDNESPNPKGKTK